MSDSVSENRLEQTQPEIGNPSDNFDRGNLYQGVAALNGAEGNVPNSASNQVSEGADRQGTGGYLDFGKSTDLYGSGHYNVPPEQLGSNSVPGNDPGLGQVPESHASGHYSVPPEHLGSNSVPGNETGPGPTWEGAANQGSAAGDFRQEASHQGSLGSNDLGGNALGSSDLGADLARTESNTIKSQGSEGSISGTSSGTDPGSKAMDSRADTPRDRNFAMWSGNFAPEKPATNQEIPAFNPKTDKLDGNQFYELNNSDMANLPVSTLEKINSNNVSNLEGRVEALGERMPDVAFRGVSEQGAKHMEKLLSTDGNQDHSNLHFAVTKEPSQDPRQQVGDMAANLRKANNYAAGSGGSVYAFDVSGSDKGEAFRKDHAKSAPAPFAPSPSTGEQILPVDKNLQHITTLSGQDVNVQQIPTNAPDYMERTRGGGVLEVNHTIQQLNKVLNSIEAPHREQLDAQRKQQDETRRQSESELQNPGIFNRLANTVKSWF